MDEISPKEKKKLVGSIDIKNITMIGDKLNIYSKLLFSPGSRIMFKLLKKY